MQTIILSVPIQGGFAYFIGSVPPLRPITSQTLTIEQAAPLLPTDAIAQGFGYIAQGMICYPQTVEQVKHLSTAQTNLQLSKIKQQAQPQNTQAEESGLLEKIAAGLITTLAIKGILE